MVVSTKMKKKTISVNELINKHWYNKNTLAILDNNNSSKLIIKLKAVNYYNRLEAPEQKHKSFASNSLL